MKIVFAASEAAPFIKTGGLGDVASALPTALSEYKGNEVMVFLPYYAAIKHNPLIAVEQLAVFETPLAWRRCYTGLFRLKSRKRKLQIYFIDNEQYFAREAIYGHYDDGERFAFFSRAILESLVRLGKRPDVIHCNDWQTALIPAMLHTFYGESLPGVRTVFTIHNIEYQGITQPYFLCDTLGFPPSLENTFSFGGVLNFVKGAILTCDRLTTVSRTYAHEIRHPYFAHGLASIIEEHAFKTSGIVNGIDTVTFDPATDSGIACHYSADDIAGKAACKAALQRELGLPERPDVPLVALVSRLVGHKGLDILCDAMDEMMGAELQFVILGTGDSAYERRLSDMAARYGDKLSVNLRFSGALASRIYAACDLYLMPSKSEPCGLSQLIAMRYGAVPIVHETGGLADTVPPFKVESGEGLGFTFSQFNREDMLYALWRALDVYYNDPAAFARVRDNGMRADLSWSKSAGEYMDLYRELTDLS